MNEFLNPKAMSTPGAAGALMMLIANSLCSNFPEFAFRYVALALSFVIGAVVFAAATMKIWERGVYWVVNSLIIFSMGVGATNIAANVAEKRVSNERAGSVASAVVSFFSGVAFAESGQQPAPPRTAQEAGTNGASRSTTPSQAELLAQLRARETRIRELESANRRLQNQALSANPDAHPVSERQNRFFRRW